MFKPWEIGVREYGVHSFYRVFRVVNYFWVQMFAVLGRARGVGSRFFGSANGPINHPGLFVYCLCTAYVLGRCRFGKSREQYKFNA